MKKGFLIGRIPLKFSDRRANAGVREDVSAVALDERGDLWVASDEATGIDRLRGNGKCAFGKNNYYDLRDAFRLPDNDELEEIDIEGMSVSGNWLWITGSHTSSRPKPRRENDREDIDRLAKVRRKPNRYLVGRVALRDGGPGKARHLPYTESGNSLTDALSEDPHLGPFLHRPGKGERGIQLATKENGFDVEGLASRGNRLFLGLRGPVLRGWAAMLIEIDARPAGQGELKLKKIGRGGRRYRKHFVDLDGMGVRDLCWHGDDLLVLAGPTMDLSGQQTVWRLRCAAGLDDDSIIDGGDKRRERLFDLPMALGEDKAEGLELYDGLGEPGLMIVYDAPSAARKPGSRTLLSDVFRLP